MKRTSIGALCEAKIHVTSVVPDGSGRGMPRVELSVYGARYPYKLSPAQARTLADLLSRAADALDVP